MTQGLQKAEFTNVEVVPESFLVRVKDKDGKPIMMVLNPDSITSVIEVSAPGASGNSGKQSTASAAPSGTTKQK